MVRRLIQLLSREISGIHDAAYLLAFFAVASQLLALVRDRLFAHSFGASETLDLYYAAFRVPDIVFVTVASLVSLSVLIPFLVEKIGDREKTREFIDSIFTYFITGMIAVTGAVYLLMPFLLRLIFPAFEELGLMNELVWMSRILLLSPLLLGVSNLFASITQVHNRFFVYALSPLLYNIGIISGLLVLYPRFGVYGLAFGVVTGALLHALIQIPAIIECKLVPRFKLFLPFSPIKKVAMLSLPRTLAVSSMELAKLFLLALAALIATGSISVFILSFNLQSVPLSVIGVSYSLAVFPTLSRLFSKGDKKEFLEKVALTARHIIFLSIPVTALVVVVRAQLVRTVLGSGEFSWADTRLTAAALALFVLSLVPQGLLLLFVRAFYSGGKTRIPLYINLIAAGITTVSAIVLVRVFEMFPTWRGIVERLLRVEDVPGTAVLMLPLAYTIGSFVGVILMWVWFERHFGSVWVKVRRMLWQIVLASGVSGAVSYMLLHALSPYFDTTKAIGVFLHGFIAGIAGIFVGVIILLFLKNTEIHEVFGTLKRRIWKTPVVQPEPDLD